MHPWVKVAGGAAPLLPGALGFRWLPGAFGLRWLPGALGLRWPIKMVLEAFHGLLDAEDEMVRAEDVSVTFAELAGRRPRTWTFTFT